ncbi:hypothetical protein [Gramella sp. MAR_2010_147]|uniref:hypothetical protein n=1 Tax=Gramella sp. MAR_2010_147 TaxID=1250205 RepID=UPI00087AEC59|nr:hypothetical protein [Gramella sp. MAR_2010_147]SDS06186.1 hypothetical protein SAMN04488553_1378 [Gramella sp. MAR_2010_147]
MLDKFKAKGSIPSYRLDEFCIVQYAGKDRFTGGRVELVSIPNMNKTEYLEGRIFESSIGYDIKIEGNLRKWMYGAKCPVKDLHYNDYCNCIKLIAKRLGVAEEHIWNLEFTYLEMGGNIKLPRNYEKFIPCLISFPELNLDRWKESTVYFSGAKYSIIFYDKLKELRDKKMISGKVANKLIKKLFILRFEIRIAAKSGYRKNEQIQNFGALKENWNNLLKDWIETFKKAKAIDLFSDSVEVPGGTLTKAETAKYFVFLLINEIGVDRGLYLFKHFMKDRKYQAVDYIQSLFRDFKSGEEWDYYNNILKEVDRKAERMKKGFHNSSYNNKKTTPRIGYIIEGRNI